MQHCTSRPVQSSNCKLNRELSSSRLSSLALGMIESCPRGMPCPLCGPVLESSRVQSCVEWCLVLSCRVQSSRVQSCRVQSCRVVSSPLHSTPVLPSPLVPYSVASRPNQSARVHSLPVTSFARLSCLVPSRLNQSLPTSLLLRMHVALARM